jgi:hypothetical protein
MSSKYISLKETAVLIRKALAAKFPGTKFSVRGKSYSGGASISVNWTDGPSKREVEAITDRFAAGRFNGMIDMAYSAYHWMMPDGSVVHAGNSHDGMGEATIDKATPPAPGATLVHFGSDYVHANRTESIGLAKRAAARLLASRGETGLSADAVIEPSPYGGWKFTSAANALDMKDAAEGGYYGNYFTSALYAAIAGLNADTGLRFSKR